MEKSNLARKLALLGGSFAIIASALIIYFHVPPLPVALGGALALFLTVSAHFSSKR